MQITTKEWNPDCEYYCFIFFWLQCELTQYRSAGYAIALVAESTGNCILSAEAVASPGAIPEDLGKKAANLLLSEVLNVTIQLLSVNGVLM